MATNTASVYCAAADMYDVMSYYGIKLAVDDIPPHALGNAIAKAGNKIDFYLAQRYPTSELLKSDMVKDWAAILACVLARRRRGNPVPQGLAEAYDEAMAELKQVKDNLANVPGIAPYKSSPLVISKMRATQRPYPRAVVEVSQSTTLQGPAVGYQQHRDPWDRYGFNADAFLNWSL